MKSEKNRQKTAMAILIAVAMIASISVVISPVMANNNASSERTLPPTTPPTLSLAPGYCPSSGGSHLYESIQSVSYAQKPGETLTITVNIWIANPDGCVAGEPCPAYDASPEYVNAWIDWDGDKVFESNERVLDKDLTGYLGINYLGTMSTGTIVTIPADAVSSTWMRVNLGWDHDPNDPCEESWTWGDVIDKEINIAIKPPKIEKIIVTGIPDAKNPTVNDPSTATEEKVKLEAKITTAEGFEVTKVSWSGDVTAGEGNPYEYTAARGTHGKKKVKCTITYKNKVTGETGTDTKTKEFKLFFVKTGHEDGAGKPPNWFKYWSKVVEPSLLGALKPKMVYSGSSFFVPGTKEIHLSDGDACSYSAPFGLHNPLKGIDNFVWTVVHESQHYAWDVDWWSNNYATWLAAKGKTGPNDDKDGDRVPNKVEDINLNGTWDPPAEKYNWSKYLTPGAPAAIVNDEEWKNCWDHRDVTGTHYHKKDWANPGKQIKDSPLSSPACKELVPVLLPTATFDGTYSDIGTDTDGDGLYNYLTIEAGVSVAVAGNYKFSGGLRDSEGNVWLTDTYAYLDVGSQSVTLNFDGLNIHQSRVNGPYNLFDIILSDNYCGLHDFVSDAYTTSAYNYKQFERKATEFTGTYSDYGTDTDGDGLYNYLTTEVEVNTITPGDYRVEGGLYDGSGNAIIIASNSVYLNAGSQSISLNFDGLAINRNRADGPYYLRYLSLYGSGQIDFIYDAYTTAPYKFTDFQEAPIPLVALTGNYWDYGTDIDSDGVFDYLTVDAEVMLANPGYCIIKARLMDINGEEIVWAENTAYLEANQPRPRSTRLCI
jgi:hypothetical protein